MLPSFSLPPLEFCFGTTPIQAEKSRPDRNAFGSAMLATRAVASAGPTPGISSSRRLVSLERCQAMIRRSNSKIVAFKVCNWAPRAATHVRATSGNRLSLLSATTCSSCSTPWRPPGATIPNSARWARMALITEVCWRMNRSRVRCSVRQLCCPGVLVATNRMFGLLTASQIASASVASCASFDTNQARRQLLEESQDVAALQLAADDHLAVSINAMDLKNRLRDIETDCRDRLHG